MFASIVTVMAVCVALAISGWDPGPDLYDEDSTQLMLTYDQPSFDWPYEISMDEIAEWFLFFDDRKLIDHQYSETHQCDCYGTAVGHGDHVIPGVGKLPNPHITSYQTIQTPRFSLKKLTFLINGIASEMMLTRWTDVPVPPKPGSLIRVNPRERSQWQTISLDGRLLLLSILLQIAFWGYKHFFSGKKIKERIKSCQLTEESLEMFGRDIKETLARSEAALRRLDRLVIKPKKLGSIQSHDKEDNSIQPGDMFSWTSNDGYSSNWHKISSTKATLSKDTIDSPLYDIPEWRYLTKEW